MKQDCIDKMNLGKFIVIEGPDGSGSTTHVRLVGNYLESKERKVLLTKEPTNNVIGRLIRGLLSGVWQLDPYGMQLLFCSDRAHHLEREVVPTLEKGWDVLMDRYALSTIVYGSQALNKDNKYSSLGVDYWKLLFDINSSFRVPDLTLILDVSPAECMKRIYANRPETELFEKEDVLARVLEGYKRLAGEYKNCVLIDGSGTREEVHSRIVDTIEKKLFPEQNP